MHCGTLEMTIHTGYQVCLEDESTEFEHSFHELSKLHIEAKDNLKFLSTLERHLKMMSMAPLSSLTE